MTALRQILAGAALALAFASPALANEDEDRKNVRLLNYSLTLAEAMGQAYGVSAQCHKGAHLVPEGRLVVLDLLRGHLTAVGLSYAADAYDRGVLAMRAQYAASCEGAKEVQAKLVKDVRFYKAEVLEMLGLDETGKRIDSGEAR